jgi:hypothetical protein
VRSIRQAGKASVGAGPNGKRIAAAGGLKKNSSVASWLRCSTAVVRTVFSVSIRLPEMPLFSMVRSWVQTLGISRREDARTLEKPVSKHDFLKSLGKKFFSFCHVGVSICMPIRQKILKSYYFRCLKTIVTAPQQLVSNK